MLRDYLNLTKRELYGYVGLLLIIVSVTAVFKATRHLFPNKEEIIIEIPPDAAYVDDIGRLDTLHINTATKSQMISFGFRRNEYLAILSARQAGYVFSCIDDITTMRSLDSARMAAFGPRILFDTIPARKSYPQRDYSRNNYSYDNYKTGKNNYSKKDYSKNDYHKYDKKVSNDLILYKITESTIDSLGLSRVLWDSIQKYQDQYFLTGKISVDELASATPVSIGELMAPHLGTPKQRDVKIKVKATKTIDINTATEQELSELSWISEWTAKRIVERRDKLGGFVSTRQLTEIYGIDSLRYTKIAASLTLDPAKVKKIKINSWTESQLANHPYIGKELARFIYKYRSKHNIQSIQDIRDNTAIDVDYTYLEHYISFE